MHKSKLQYIPSSKSVGKTYGRLFVLKVSIKNDIAWAKCRCKCKDKTICYVRLSTLRNGTSRSCGCFQKEVASKVCKLRNTTHGEDKRNNKTPEYEMWKGIKQRVFNPKNKAWPNYGGRGIKILYYWAKSFIAFITWIEENIGRRPGDEYSIDRIDNDKGYFPGNLKWSTKQQQANNRRPKSKHKSKRYK